MSGPKVVRIVTREEIIATCKGLLAGLNEVIQQWMTFCRANGVATEDEIAATLARWSALAKLMAKDRFEELQKAVPAEIDFLKADRQTRFERAAEKKAKVLAGERRTKAAAVGILAALNRNGKSVSNDLRSSLEQIAAGRTTDTAAIARAFTLLSEDQPTGLSELQQKLASDHKGNETHQTFGEWLAAQSEPDADDEFKRLDLLLAQLSVVLGEKAVGEFQERLRSVSSQETSPNRDLLIDSLEVDLAQAVNEARERSEIEQRLKMLAAELSAVGSEEAEKYSRSIETQLHGRLESLQKLEQEAKEILKQAVTQIAAQSRREAVLKGLAELGYHVSEGMETAWVQNGSIVLKRTLESGYGVEISGKIDSGRVQMRTVAFRHPTRSINATKDQAAETSFCSDVSKLQQELAEAGNQILIERAVAIGTAPVKTVSVDMADEETRRLAPPVKQRTVK